jgi:excisionase family DNA binding protein
VFLQEAPANVKLLDYLSPEARDELRRFVREEIEAALCLTGDARRWLTVRETATYLGVTETAVRRRIARGRIPTKRQGRSVLIDREELDRILERS